MKCMDSSIRGKSAEVSTLEQKLDQQSKLIQNLEMELKDEQVASQNYALQIKSEGEKYEALAEQLNEEKKKVCRINEQHEHYQSNHEMETQQLNEALKHKEELARLMQFEISQER